MSNIRTLDLNLLRVFEALFRHGNVTRASEDLGLTQPAVSAALSRLRGHLGDALFVRVGNGMVPTPRAETLAPIVADVLDRIADAISDSETFDPATATQTMTLRGADFFSTRLMPTLSARISREAPGIALRFLDSARGELVGMIESGQIDLALEQPMEVPQWVSRDTLFPSPFVIAAARDNPAIAGLAPGEPMPIDTFCALPHAIRSMDGSMHGMTDAALAQRGLTRRVMLALPHFDAVMGAVARSNLIAAVPVQLANEDAENMGLTLFQPPFPFPVPTMQLYWHSRLDRAPAQVWLRHHVLDEVARLWGRDASFDQRQITVGAKTEAESQARE